MGNTADGTACADDNVVNTFVATSSDGGLSWSSATRISDVGHQPNFEMFGNRNIPFQGDYNWVSLVDTGSGLEAYAVWTDNRDVVIGDDPREDTQDGFDVWQCREQDDDDVWGPDTCANARGLNQNIYGNRVSVP